MNKTKKKKKKKKKKKPRRGKKNKKKQKKNQTLSSVLYPDDRTYEGKELRLKQQHFFVSATIQDVVRRYREAHPETWDVFADKVRRKGG